MRLFLILLSFVLAASCTIAATQSNEVVVLANRNVPESIELARYYVERRGLDPANILTLDLPAGETISRDFYELRLRDPLLSFLRDRGLVEQVKRDSKQLASHESEWSTVKASFGYIVSMYGVPTRIADTRSAMANKVASLFNAAVLRDGGSVDSELALILQDSHEIRGRVPNPAYNVVRWEDQGDTQKPVIVAARLDAPLPSDVKRMIDDSLRADRFGLTGRFYFDSRAPHTDEYRQGDFWIVEAYERLRREGYECYLDRMDPVWGLAFPMEDAAYYLGWYLERIEGPFLRPNFRFKPGAIAYHLHSASAKVLRQGTNFWAGPLLARGAAATLGAVGEPYLRLTPDLQILTDRLCQGINFGRSAYMALSSLSWQITVIGDPLFAPFALSADQQITNLESASDPDVVWAYLRKANLLVLEGRFNLALAYLREKDKANPSLILRERIADLYASNGLTAEALEEYKTIVRDAATPETAVRNGLRLLLGLRHYNRMDEAALVEKSLREKWKDSSLLGLLQSLPQP